MRSKLEPLRGKLVRLVDRGWLRKLPDGRFTPLCDLLHRRLRQRGAGVTGAPPETVGIV